MKGFIFKWCVLFFVSLLFFGVMVEAEEPTKEEISKMKIEPPCKEKETDVLLEFYDDSSKIISINCNGTVEWNGDLDYISEKFWELMIGRLSHFCQRAMIVSNPKEFDTIKIGTMKGDILLKKDHIKNTVSVIHLNTLDDLTVKFWKAIEEAFPRVCK